jgi:hypothetical protein
LLLVEGMGVKSLQEILELFTQKIPPQYVSKKPVFGRTNGKLGKQGEVDFVSWPHLCLLLDKYTDGFWNWEVRTQFLGDRVVIEGRLSIITSDGVFIREATGWESMAVDGYGDATSNAEAMALRRACSKFGLGRYLWEKSESGESSRSKGEISREEWLRRKNQQKMEQVNAEKQGENF